MHELFFLQKVIERLNDNYVRFRGQVRPVPSVFHNELNYIIWSLLILLNLYLVSFHLDSQYEMMM